MSGSVESRAAVFTSEPQDVEVYQAGAWWPGSLLGWRHDNSGNCQVWVRVVIGGVEETAWTDLTTLRLPERSPDRHLAMAPTLSATEHLKVVAGRAPLPERADSSSTQSLPAVRGGGSPSVPVQRPGGRRRAPEPATAEFSFSGAAGSDLPGSGAVGAPGRHRAAGMGASPIVPGRHRAADTGIWSALSPEVTGRLAGPVDADLIGAPSSGGGRRRADRSGATAVAAPVAPVASGPVTPAPADAWTSRTAPAPAGPPSRRAAAREAEPDLLTRPMRLDDLAGQSRKPRLDGFRTA